MALTNHERVGKGLDFLRDGLGPFIEREMASRYGDEALEEARRLVSDDRVAAKKALAQWDVNALLRLMWEGWNDVFKQTLGHAERSLVSELREVRNRWAH